MVRKWDVSLRVRPEVSLLPLVVGCAEKAAVAFGLDEPEALAITLATEEIITYVACAAAPDKEMEISFRRGGYYVEEQFAFEAEGFNMKAFNLTVAASVNGEQDFEETGLLIASRMVDRFKFSQSDEGLRLTLAKEKAYPEISEIRAPEVPPLRDYAIRSPEVEEVKAFVHLVNRFYGNAVIPAVFRYPGKLVDMVASEDWAAKVAADSEGRMGGGVVWKRVSEETVEWFGPYVFNQPEDSRMSEALVDSCLEALARSGVESLITRFPTPELPKDYFERLGSVTLRPKDGQGVELEAYFRHLGEDLGCGVWSHPLLEPFLSEEYRRLFFAREIHPVKEEGETQSSFSVLSADFDRSIGSVTLRPIWWGTDASQTLASYVDVLLREDATCILFEIDLGRPWHSYFVPMLFEHGFEPRLVLPLAAKGDVVVFQHSMNTRTP
ncbi:MAG: hypothetical protein AB1733_23185 [Thermodesulfobacteriota bacterium]